MQRWLDRFYAALMALAGVAMAAAFVMVVLGIADRQFAWGLRGLDAYAGYCVAAALFLAMAGTFQRDEHIRVTLLLQRAPVRVRAALEWWCLIAAVALTGFLAWYALRLVWVSRLTHDVSQGSDATPLWLPQIAMALGCIGLLVSCLHALVARATGSVFYKKGGNEAAHVE
jgi:TRAP-type C4-dicarboxylate transport system permease small subunit